MGTELIDTHLLRPFLNEESSPAIVCIPDEWWNILRRGTLEHRAWKASLIFPHHKGRVAEFCTIEKMFISRCHLKDEDEKTRSGARKGIMRIEKSKMDR
jgi:hypothetical protein